MVTPSLSLFVAKNSRNHHVGKTNQDKDDNIRIGISYENAKLLDID
jgi:hypothetical protein